MAQQDNDYMYRRMMREAMSSRRYPQAGGGNRGLLGFLADAVNGYRQAKEDKADEDMLQTGLQAEYAAGVSDPRQALMNVLQKNPALIAHDAFKDNSTIQEMLHPPSRGAFAAIPGSTIYDSTGKILGTVPGKPGMGMSSEVQQALVAAGWKGAGEPTDQQWAGAAQKLGVHLGRNPTEFEQVMSALKTPEQRQAYLEHLAGNNPNNGVANEITKLTQLERQAQAAGDTVAAQRYGTAAQKLSEQPGLMSLLNNPNLGAPPQSNDQPSPQPPLPTDQSGNPLATPSDNSIPQPPPEKPPVPAAAGGDDDSDSAAAAPSSPAVDPQAIVNELRNRGIQIQ